MGDKRSPNYPAVGLGKAIEDVRSWWDKEKRSPVAAEVGVKAWGYSMLSGPARSRISALKKYGLLDETPNGFKLSERGLVIAIHKPEEREYQQAVREAALEPELFRELSQTYSDASEDAIINHLIMKRHFVPLGAKQAAKAFKDTLDVAKLRDSSYTPRGGNGAGDKLVAGDPVQWESHGALQFDKPRKITGFSEDGAYAYVEGTSTGIPVQQLQKVEGAPQVPPYSELARESPKAGMRREVFALDNGEAILQWPAQLTADGVAELKDWLNLVIRKVERLSKAEPKA